MWKKVKLLGVAFVIGTSVLVSLMSVERTPTVQAASNYSETGVYPGVSSASTTRVHANMSYNGSGDYSVRVYNNSRNSLRAGISITAH